jgi:hypothetical protein
MPFVASTCRILARSTPVAEVLEAEAPTGFSLAELLSEGGRYHVEVDGVVLAEPHQYVVAPADRLVTVVGVPGDPFTVASAIYGALTAIGVGASVAYGVGLVVGAVVSFTATYGAYIAAIASLVTVATFDTPSVQQPPPPEKQNAITGTGNRFAPFAPCPVVYGKRRLFPTLCAAPFTELVGQDQYLNQLFLVSLGDCDLSAMKIGDALATTFDAIEVSRHHPSAPAWPVVTDTDVSIQLDDQDWGATPNRSHTATTGANATAAALDFNFPIGLMYTNSKGDRRKVKLHFRVDYRLQGATTWLNVRNIAWVETTKGTNAVMGVAGKPVKQSAGGIQPSTRLLTHSIGTVSSKAADTPTAGKTTITVSTAIAAYTEQTYRIRRTSPATEYVATPAASGGSLTQWVVNNADAANFSVGNAVQIVDDGDSNDFMLHELKGEAFRAGIKFPLGAAGTYEIRVTRTYLQQNDVFTNPTVAGPTLEAEGAKYQQIMYWTLLHTYTERQAVALPASVPATFLKVRIRATDQLNGQLDNVSVLAERKLRYWTGSAWAGPTKTRSPAWAMLDMLVNKGINQRGYGETDAATYIDLNAFLAWNAGLITTEGFSYDEVVDYPVSVYNAMRRAAGVGWAGIAIPDGKFSITQDVASSPVQMFTPRNSWGFRAAKGFVDLPHALKVQFDSEDADNKQDQILVYADGYNSGNAAKFETVRLPGVTDADHAWKMGRRMIALAKLRPETFDFQADVEHVICRRGDAILMQHDVTLWGSGSGRITAKAVDTPSPGTTTVTLDQAATTTVGPTYEIRVRNTNATPPTFNNAPATPAVSAGENTQWRVTNAQASLWQIGDLAAVGETNKAVQQLKVLDIRPTSDLRANITAVDDAAGVYTAHTGSIPAYSPNITLPPDPRSLPPATPEILTVAADTASIGPDGSRTIGATVAYDGDGSGTAIVRYRVTPEGDEEPAWTYETRPVVDGAVTVYGVEAGIEYDFEVAVERDGLRSAFSTPASVTVPTSTPAVVYDPDLDAYVHAGTIKGAVVAPNATMALPVLNGGKECSIFSVGGASQMFGTDTSISSTNAVLATAPQIYAPDQGTATTDQWRRLQDMRQPVVVIISGEADNRSGVGETFVVTLQCRYDAGSWKDVLSFSDFANAGTENNFFSIETIRPPTGSWDTIDLRVVCKTSDSSTACWGGAAIWWVLPNLGLQGMSVVDMPSI